MTVGQWIPASKSPSPQRQPVSPGVRNKGDSSSSGRIFLQM